MKAKVIICELLMVFATLIWGCAFVFQALGMDYVDPFTFNVARSVVGSLFLVILALGSFSYRKIRKIETNYKTKDLIIASIIVGLSTGVAMAFQQLGVQMEGSGKSGFITALYIVFVPLIGLIFGKKVHPLILIGIVFGLSGLYLINFDTGVFDFTIGSLFLLLCSIAYSIQIYSLSILSHKCDSFSLTAGQFIVAGIIQVPLMFIFEHPSWSAIYDARWAILFVGILSSGVAYAIQTFIQKYVPANIASMIMSLESVFSVIFGILILHEAYSWYQYVGCALIFAAVIVSQLEFKKKDKKKTLERD